MRLRVLESTLVPLGHMHEISDPNGTLLAKGIFPLKDRVVQQPSAWRHIGQPDSYYLCFLRRSVNDHRLGSLA